MDCPPSALPSLRQWPWSLPWVFLLALLGLAQAPVHAASIRLGIDREIIALGDNASFRVVIEGGNGQEQPQIPDVPGLRFTRIGSNMSYSFANGRQNASSESVYTVTATRVGTYTLGPVQAVVGNQNVRSDTLTLRVTQPNDPAAARQDGLDQVAFLRLQLPERPVYVGETFVSEIHLYALGGNLKQVPVLQADGFTVGKLQDGGQEGNIRTNNRIYSRARFLQPVTAARSGALEIQAANCILDVQLSRRGGGPADFFEETFFGLRETKRLTLSTPPARVTVLPLPRERVPNGFAGAVGDFEIQLSVTPTNARAGDPLTVRIEVSGKGNFDSVQWNEPPEWKGFRIYPPNPTFATEDPLGITGTKRFEQVVTPESSSITELPALNFSFFSPASQSYRVLRTRPIALTVAPGAASPPIPLPAGTTAAAPPAEETAPELAPLRHQLGHWTPPRAEDPQHRLLLALAAAPWLAWLAWRGLGSARRRFGADPETHRRRALQRSIRTGLESLAAVAQAGDGDRFFTQLFRVLQESVALRADLPPASITEGDLESVLRPRGVDEATLQSLHRLFQSCNHARYAQVRAPSDLEAVRQDALATLRQVGG